jgi:PAS domain S-box-containing protein
LNYQYVPYIWPLSASALVTLALAIYALWRRDVRGALPFGLCMLLASLWAASNALERAGIDLPTILFWSNIPFISYTVCPILWLIMVLLFVERDRWITTRNMLLLLILPAITLILLWTGDPFSLIRQNVSLDLSGSFPLLSRTFGPWFWLILGYADALNIVSLVLLGITLRRKSLLYRKQVIVLLIGLGLVVLQNAAYLAGIYPASYLDLTPVVMGISGLIIAWGIFSFRLFDIMPVARENIIENMTDGLVVLDAQNRIVDINQTAETIFGNTSRTSIGQDARVFFSNWPVINTSIDRLEKSPGDLVIEQDGRSRIYEVSCSQLYDRWRKYNGMYFIFHDVTGQRDSQARLLEQQKILAISNERERLARDLHDDLGQVFGFINVQAQAIKRELTGPGTESAANKLERLIEVTQSTHRKMRDYIRGVKNIIAAEKDFILAVKQEAELAEKRAGLTINLDISGDLPGGLEPVVWNHILSIIKEALNNIQKHAAAGKVSVMVESTSGKIRVIIADDGIGFDLAKLENGPLEGLGLNIMKERAAEIGGQLIIDTSPGKGTRVTLTVPLPVGNRGS